MAIWKPKVDGKASRYFWGSFTHPKTLKRVRKSLKATDRSAAEIVLNEMQRKAAREAAGIIDPYEVHKLRPLLEHLGDWRDGLLANGATAQHAQLSYNRAKRILDHCEFFLWADLSASEVQTYLAGLRKDGLSVASTNYYLQAVKGFCRWMMRDHRAPDHPLVHLQGGNAQTDRRHSRRELSADEMQALLDATRKSADGYGMSGPDRATLYMLAMETGLRASELRTLTWDCIDATYKRPSISVRAAYAKNRRDDTLPLKPETAQMLTRWRDARGKVEQTDPVFPTMPAKGHIAEMLRDDLAAARKSWIKAGVNAKERELRERASYCKYRDDSGRVSDFHALRHTFISNLARGGVHPKLAQQLARHSTISLTMDRYTHTVRGELADALTVLPDLSDGSKPMRMKATGTHNNRASIDPNKSTPARMTKSCQSAVQSGEKRPEGTGAINQNLAIMRK